MGLFVWEFSEVAERTATKTAVGLMSRKYKDDAFTVMVDANKLYLRTNLPQVTICVCGREINSAL